MVEPAPTTELVSAFSSPGATPTPWESGREILQAAEVSWLSTVRADGRPHVTPLLAIWLDGAAYVCSGRDERKAQNLVGNPRCVLTTGVNTLDDGVDLVIEGEAAIVTDEDELARVADAYETKYGEQFTAPEGTWFGLADAMRRGGDDLRVYRISPVKALGFGKGRQFSQTRWRWNESTPSS